MKVREKENKNTKRETRIYVKENENMTKEINMRTLKMN